MEAEQRLETATSLHEFFTSNNRTPSALALDLSPPSASPTDLPGSPVIGQRQQYDNLMAIADTYIQSTRMVVEQAALAMEEARDSVALQKDELQAAMTVLMMHQEGYTLVRGQIEAIKKSVEQKEGLFRAIWRMPVEIWRIIFGLLIGELEEEIASESEGESRSGRGRRGCEMLQLSGVCHNWRVLVQSLPIFWSHIHIPQYVTPGDLERINHYYGLCDKSRLTITVLSLTMLDVRCFKPLYNLFDTSTPCKKITLFIRAPGVPALNAFLPSLPPPTELSIIRYSPGRGPEEMERTPTPTIPASYCKSIRNLYISAAGAQWLDELAMRLEKYHITAPPVSAIFGPHRFIPSSLQSLQSIGIQGRLYDTAIPPPSGRWILPNIRETVMDLSFLATVFTRHYCVPALQRLIIPTGSTISQAEWLIFVAEVEQSTNPIAEVCCHSFEDGIESLAECLVSLREVKLLELRGSSVDTLLQRLTLKLENGAEILPGLRRLVVHAYDGTGHSIACFLAALYPRIDTTNGKTDEEGLKRPTLEIALRACRGIAAETRNGLRGLALLV